MTDKELMQEALKWHDHIKALANGHADDELYQTRSKVFDWLIEQAEKAEKYREALEFYADENNYFVDISKLELPEDIFYAEPPVVNERGIKARQALEGEE